MMNRKTILAGWCVLALSAVLSAGAQEDFFAAIRSNNVTKLRALLDRNPFISFSTDKDGATPLAAALSSPGDTLDAGRALVESGADLNGISRETGEGLGYQTRSITMAMPWPTPMHMVHSA